MEKKQGSRRYTPKEKQAALKLADKVGPAEAGKKLGIPDGTICNWRFQAKKAAEASVPATKAKRVAKFYSPSLKAQILEYVAQHGATEAAEKFGVSRDRRPVSRA